MKSNTLLVAMLLLAGCAKFPTQPMPEGHAMILIKPISSEYNHKGRAVTIKHELTTFTNGYRKPKGGFTAEYLPAGENAGGGYYCSGILDSLSRYPTPSNQAHATRLSWCI